MRVSQRLLLPLLVASFCAPVAIGSAAAKVAPKAQPAVRPVVIAVVGEAGLNVLHSDFATADGRDPALPAGYPAARVVRLPRSGAFADRLRASESGPLGHLAPDTLYRVAGTRIIGVYAATDGNQPPKETDLLADRLHGTGVTSSAVGRKYGTAPTAELVVVLGDGDNAWSWVANQPWIDIAVTATITEVDTANPNKPSSFTCSGAAGIHQLATSGRLVFAGSGDDEQSGVINPPPGLPDVYQVGGVNSDGTPWMGVHQSESDPAFATGQVTRPYVTGDLYSFTAASPDSLTGGAHFGGTSGAAPLTAGRAASLIATARAQLHTPNAGHSGALAWLGSAGSRPHTGPLADGRLTGGELSTLLRHVAVPSLPEPAGFAIEGYGALNATTMTLARRVLAGLAAEPNRSDDDTAQTAVTTARQALFTSARCG
ncbi:MAG: hypothetical protein QOC82_1140 [Frankiaceae bacterium]|nr:hypothetical protein [Frankiaceae bacterium]